MLSSTVSVGDIATATQYNNLVSDVASYAGDYATSGGSANTQTLSVNAVIVAYADKQIFKFKAGYTNTGSTTLNVNSIGAKTIKGRDGYNLKGGEIRAGNIYYVAYDGTNLQLINGNDAVVDVSSTSQTCENNVTYISSATSEITYSLPTTSAVGDKITILGRARWKVVHGAGQGITLHNSLSTDTTGWLKGDGARDSVVLRCYVANSYWVVESYAGNPQIDTEAGWGEPDVFGYIEDNDATEVGVSDNRRILPIRDGNNIYACNGGVQGVAKSPTTYNHGALQAIACTSLLGASTLRGRPIIYSGYILAGMSTGVSAGKVYACPLTSSIATAGNWFELVVSGRTWNGAGYEGFIGFAHGYVWSSDGVAFYYYTPNFGAQTLTYVGTVSVTSSTYSNTLSAVNEAGILASFSGTPSHKFCNHAGTINTAIQFGGITRAPSATRFGFYACIETDRAVPTDTLILAKIL